MRDKNGRFSVKEKEKDLISTSSFNQKEIITNKKGWIANVVIEFYNYVLTLAIRMIIDVFAFFLIMTVLNKLGIFKFFTETYDIISDTIAYIKESVTKIKEEVKNGSYGDKFRD